MEHTGIERIRARLNAKPRPIGWSERRARLDEIGSVWPVAGDIRLEPVSFGGLSAEWSRAPSCDESASCCFFTAAAIARDRCSAIVAW